ncbi:MAG: ABC transporter ATP-binding protein [Bacilli bacterium]
MLKVNNLILEINGRTILNISELTINRPGLYVLLGPSGCGKTTFLNVLAGLNTNYRGEVRVFKRDYQKMKERDITKFRASHISVFFQHNIFIEDLTLAENISLTTVNTKETMKSTRYKVEQIARSLNVNDILNQKIKTLSGGEKTRGSLARTLIKKSPLYLFDEPTAALDPHNALNVMELIKEQAKQSIIIVVTHDQELARQYGDKIFFMENGHIIKSESSDSFTITDNLLTERKVAFHKNTNFITSRLLKAKRLRNAITGFSVNLGLVGLGLSFMLINSINYKLVNTFKGQFDGESAYITPKVTPEIKAIKSSDVSTIKSTIEGDYKVGSFYVNDINGLFPTRNKLSLEHGRHSIELPSFHAALFNECLFLEEVDDELYPYIKELSDDEIGLVLPYDDFKVMQNILGLQFRNDAIDLGKYLEEHEVILTLEVVNNYWNYSDEQSFTLKTVRLGYEAQVIFGDPSYVPILFEEKMMLPSSLSLTKVEEYPWTLKKINYLYTKNREGIIWNLKNHAHLLLFTAKSNYFNYIFDNAKLLNRIFIFEKPPYFNDILKIDLMPAFYTFNGGLSFIEELMLLGFANNFFISGDEILLDEIINGDVEDVENTYTEVTYAEGIINLAIQYNGLGGMQYIGGTYNYKLNEIGISKGLAKTLFKRKDVIGEKVFIGALTGMKQSGEQILKAYEATSLQIVEVFDDDKTSLYHHPLWAYLLFTQQFGVSPLNYNLSGAVMNQPADIDDENFHVTYPFSNFKTMVDMTLNDLEKYTFFTAAGAFLLAGFIIFMVIYLVVYETSEQFSSLYLMGYSKNTIHDIVITYIIRFLGAIILFSLGQLFMLSFVIEYALSSFLQTSFTYFFSVKPYMIVILFAFSLLILLLGFFKWRMQRVDLLHFSKRDL